MIHDFNVGKMFKYSRSKIHMPHNKSTSCSFGKLFPISIVETLPNDDWTTKLTGLIRVPSGFVTPFMGDVYCDVYSFYVPLTQVYEDAERIFGIPDPSIYIDKSLATAPVTTSNSTVTARTVGDYLGLPVGSIPKGINILPFRAFAHIYDKRFRNENTVDEMLVQKGTFKSSEALNNNAWANNNYTGQLPYVSKKRDYFTSATPKAQKSANPVPLINGLIPVIDNPDAAGTYAGLTGTIPAGTLTPYSISPSGNNRLVTKVTTGGTMGFSGGISVKNATSLSSTSPVAFAMNADPSMMTAGNTIQDFVAAYNLQRSLSLDAIYGSKYETYCLTRFGQVTNDLEINEPQYLGGCSIPLNVQTVTQTSKTDGDDVLGTLGGVSVTLGQMSWHKHIKYHGYIITVGCLRQKHFYSQGIPKMFYREKREDFYDPLFAYNGEEPIYKTQIYGIGVNDLKGDVFGYQEAFADYKYIPDEVTAGMRPTSSSNIGYTWSLADSYANAPVISESFTNETNSNINRVLNVNESTNPDSFIMDFHFDTYATRVMPLYSNISLESFH